MNRIEADIHRVKSGFQKLRQPFFQQNTVRRQRHLFDPGNPLQLPDQPAAVAAKERFAAGYFDAGNAQRCRGFRNFHKFFACQIARGRGPGRRQTLTDCGAVPVAAVLRSGFRAAPIRPVRCALRPAIPAAQIAPVCYGNSYIVDLPLKTISHAPVEYTPS